MLSSWALPTTVSTPRAKIAVVPPAASTGPTLPIARLIALALAETAEDERTRLAAPSAPVSCCHDDSHLSHAARGSDRSVAAGTPRARDRFAWRTSGDSAGWSCADLLEGAVGIGPDDQDRGTITSVADGSWRPRSSIGA